MYSKNLLKYSSLGILGAVAACKSSTEKEVAVPERPNIIFIMSDDHSYQTISSYDNRYIQTPNIDRIGKGGVVFTNSFVGNSICGPSRATMLTGKLSHKNGMKDNRLAFNGSQQTFPKLLQKAGYQTAIVGKWHLRSIPTGFDFWKIVPGQGEYYNPDFINMQGDTLREEGYATDLITDHALEYLSKRDKNKPFCLLLHHKAPHRTWEPDTALFKEFAGKTFEIPKTFFDDYEGRKAAQAQHMNIRNEDMDLAYDLKLQKEKGVFCRFPYYEGHTTRMNKEQKAAWNRHYDTITNNFLAANLKGKALEKWKFQRYMQDYLSCIRSIDTNIGRVLDYLKENGLDKNTIIVYTADQGFYMGEHGWFDKRFMYEESFRTPLLISIPQAYKGKHGKVSKLVQNIDYAPTFLDFAGAEIPEDMQGMSMKPLLLGEDENNWRDALYYHYYEFPNEHMVKRHYGIRTDRYKLIHFYNDIDSWELYDLQEDKDELHNLYGKKGYEDLTAELKKQLETLQVQYEDTDKSDY